MKLVILLKKIVIAIVIIIIIVSSITVFDGVLFVHQPSANHAPGWRRDFYFIKSTLTGSQVITKKPGVQVTIDNDLMLHLRILSATRTQRGHCGGPEGQSHNLKS